MWIGIEPGATVVVHRGEAGEIKFIEILKYCQRIMNSMCIECRALSSYGNGDIKMAFLSQNPLEFFAGLAASLVINGISITAKSDMLDHMKAGNALQRTVAVRQLEDRALHRLKIADFRPERANIDEFNLEKSG